MTEELHNEIMQNILKQLDKNNLDLGEGVALWHSLGLFLFSNIDKDNKDISKIYNEMNTYLLEMQKIKEDSANK